MRNVILGLLLVFTATLLLSYATYLVGPRAVLPVGVALLTAITLFALARLRLFRQRNGGFVALGLVCLLGVIVPLIEHVWKGGVSEPVAQTVEPETTEPDSGVASTGARTVPGSLKEAFNLATPPEGTSAFRVLQDLRVEIDGKKYVINEGDVFAVKQKTAEDVRFSAGDEQIALPLNMVEMIGSPAAEQPADTVTATPPAANPATVASTPAKSGPVNITEEAQREAIRRYPAIGVKNSPENMLFVDSYQELKHSGADDFFANPEWPLALAEMLAKREKWTQPGQAAPQGGAPEAAPLQSGQGEPAVMDEPRPKRRPVAEELDEEPEGLMEEPAPKRRPVAEELDEPEPNAAPPAPAAPEAAQAGAAPTGDPAGELPAE